MWSNPERVRGAAVEERLTRILADLINPGLAPALSGALHPDGFPILMVSARRGVSVASAILDLDIAGEMIDGDLADYIRGMIEWATGDLDDNAFGGS